MINFIIFVILIIISVLGNIFLIKNNKKITELNKALTAEVVNSKKTPILMGKITKYEEKELDILLRNPEILDLLVRMLEYRIAVKTDTIRSLEHTEEKVGYLNCLHDTRINFLQIQNKLKKKGQKTGQNLV